MNIMNRVTWKSMWENRTRTLVTIIGVILSAAMFMTVTTTVYSLWDFLVRGRVYESGDYYLQFDYATDAQAEELAREKDILHIARFRTLGYYNTYDQVFPDGTFRLGAVDETFLETMAVPLIEGRLPRSSSELVLPERFNLLREYLEQPAVQIGETVTLDLFRMLASEPEYEALTGVEQAEFQKTYTIVGIMEDRSYMADSPGAFFYSMLTLADGAEGETLWNRLYVKTVNPFAVSALSGKSYGGEDYLYREMLMLYGSTGLSNANLLIVGLACMLVLIIMIASVGLISNAFSISVAERTKQFGLLASIGATRKQIRGSVRFEALVVGALGIPAGLLAGYGIVAWILHFYGEHILSMFSFSTGGHVGVYAVPSLAAALVAVLICGLTIRLSVWLPTRRAAKVSPMESIRQNRELHVRPRDVKVGWLTGKLFGLPGVLAKKYYQTDRRKYRSTVISLVVSMVLYIVSSYFCQGLNLVADASGVEDYDFSVTSLEENRDEVYERLRSTPGVSKSVLLSSCMLSSAIPTDGLNEKYKEVAAESWGTDFPKDGWTSENVHVIFLEDEVFIAHLESEGIDPTPYLEKDGFQAVTIKQTTGGFYVQDENGEWYQMIYHGSALKESVTQLQLMQLVLPDVLYQESWDMVSLEQDVAENGMILLEVLLHSQSNGVYDPYGKTVGFFALELTDEMRDGKTLCRYYSYDAETGAVGRSALAEEYITAMNVNVGACLEERPFGVSGNSGTGITLILPMSKMAGLNQESFQTDLHLKAGDYNAVLSALNTHGDGNLRFGFTNYAESQQNARGLVTILEVFATGFIILIALISAANVFNTISTNVSLRRRDFGMLRSVGLRTGDIYRMMMFECMNYGMKAICWSMPISLALCVGIYRLINVRYSSDFDFPWSAAGTGLGILLLVVFVTMVYGVSKLRKDSPIDAIRMENT